MKILKIRRNDHEVHQYHQHAPRLKSNPPKSFHLDRQTLAHFLDHQSALRLQESHSSRVLCRPSSRLHQAQLEERPVFSQTWSKKQSPGAVSRLHAKSRSKARQLEELVEGKEQRLQQYHQRLEEEEQPVTRVTQALGLRILLLGSLLQRQLKLRQRGP